jgi:hypothetical protein
VPVHGAPSSGVGRGSPSRQRPRALAAWISFVIVAIAVVVLAGRLTFHWLFQVPLERRHPSSLIWRAPVEAAATSADWGSIEHEGYRFPVPPGGVGRIDVRDGSILLFVETERVRFDRFEFGFVRDTLAKQAEQLGVSVNSLGTDGEVLAAVARTTPAEYRFMWGSQERFEYAARALVKLLLWDPRPVARFELGRGANEAVASLVAFRDGEVRISLATADGFWVVQLTAAVPPSWLVSPCDWLPVAIERATPD